MLRSKRLRGCALLEARRNDYSTLTLASLITLPHFAGSVGMRSANSAGELKIEKMKFGVRNFSRNAGSLKMRCVSALSLATVSGGVPLGAARPYHEPAS